MSNLLSEVHPELVLEWSERNLPLTPDKITYGSNKIVWWIGTCGHELRSASRSRPETALPKRARIFGTTTLRPITAPFLLTILSCSLVVSSSTAIREQSQPRGVLRTRAATSWLTQSLHSFSFGKP